MSIDDAFVVPLIALRPATFEAGDPSPRPALLVRFPGTTRMREAVVTGLLRRGWDLVAAPVGDFVPRPEAPVITVNVREGGVLVSEPGGEVLYDGPLLLDDDSPWLGLARGTGEVVVLVTVANQPLIGEVDANRVARRGHLVGVVGTVE